MKNPPSGLAILVLSVALGACASKPPSTVSIGPRWTNTANVALMPTPPAEEFLLAARSRVELLAERGAFAKIQTPDGLTGYVPMAALDSEPPKETRRRAIRPSAGNAVPGVPVAVPDSGAPDFRL